MMTMSMLSLSLPLIQTRAVDRTIPFGKHKGRMLGTLPSRYLTWVSNNLRAREFREWAELADEVLADPVYRDRLEWESAQRILAGDNIKPYCSNDVDVSSELMEMSGRFGWDNEDREGWARVDFDLLGTSMGGRIPRIVNGSRRDGKLADDIGKEEEKESKVAVAASRGKREERREKRRRRVRMAKKEVRVEVDGSGSGSGRVEYAANPFPGRGALLEKIGRRA